ncbi:transglycosylase SLT domain-containing protein [Thiorhodococcus mannitoliphagus]|uniref:Transglycosylase SLT domain-containing protein n=1 Tax=Thiorhodococcus mannitoliphagus TaxID=329406 RepID=A0A6P1E053_9GAMM|nr:transglycosylase SLT domain-containing protein [Thiorhodococcus mannitoliphagus]NEX22406.1 transglycosylase SLT domain-containing protein [Thiorhodococcus mannitoliphagus]
MPPSDETLYSPRLRRETASPPGMRLDFVDDQGQARQLLLTEALIVGRADDAGLQLSHPLVSRQHLVIYPEAGRWWLRDLQSSNGTRVADRPVDKLPLDGVITAELGSGGPRIKLSLVREERNEPATPTREEVSRRYLDDDHSGDIGEHTQFIRQAFKDVKRRQRRLYLGLISVVLLLLMAVGGYALFQHEQLVKTTRLANDIFYDMKELELQIANVEAEVDADASAELKAQVAESRRRLVAMRERYDAFVEQVQAARPIPLDSEDKLILHVARIFGETEVDVPHDFAAEVKKYIRKWQASSRLRRAIRRLKENGYGPIIRRELEGQGLPPQFIYLALQETNFQARAVGPPTRYGRAKGMWQFIPATGKRYGLQPGPLQQTGQFDPEDERHDVAKATRAAAKYLKDIYRTDAQASGLLVMASYNWGEGNIIKRLRKMPENPRERNFWKLLRDHKIPKETYDYVFYIVSATVICENPALFGFDFANPLAAG